MGVCILFDLADPTLRKWLSERRPFGAFWFSLGSTALIETAVAAGAEAIVIDLQHGLFERKGMEAAIGVVPGNIPCIVRVEDHSAAAIGRALDAGAEGILIPLIETAEQAALAASACHYPPAGHRSGGGVRPLLDFERYRDAAGRAVTVGVMIETARGVENAREIAKAGLVDFVFIGTGDLALSLGRGFDRSSLEDEACAAILAACTEAGKPCGSFTVSPDSAAALIGRGYWMTVVANDITATRSAFDLSLRTFAEGRAAAPCTSQP
ncbi:HpcH/HpaI aldolase family protein [Microbaculum marinum]|uniref:Aldolase/citrate lyase family protein n=1 Tax=Microbaculum marinum TaxID=1764581 RepID=A0AAW9RXK6_9HYPH